MLLNAIKKANSTPTQLHIAGVSKTQNARDGDLPKINEEVEFIQQHADKNNVVTLMDNKATCSAVLDAMSACSWVHLACHGIQTRGDAMSSAFCLYDGRLHLSRVISQNFPHGDLAFLSACQTATGSEDLPEEAAHLAAGMLMAGYKGVIATMWSIRDSDAPIIANAVYSELFSGDRPDGRKAALALHNAVKVLQEEIGEENFIAWVPYIHMGF